MKRYFFILAFLWLHLGVKSSPDTVSLSLYKYNKPLIINNSCKLIISYIDSFGNKIVIKPRIQNGSIYAKDFKFLKNCTIKFNNGHYHFSFYSAILIFDKKINWRFGIDTTLLEYFRKYPEFMDRLPSKHKYYYLEMEPLYEGLGYTEYRFLNYRKKSKYDRKREILIDN